MWPVHGVDDLLDVQPADKILASHVSKLAKELSRDGLLHEEVDQQKMDELTATVYASLFGFDPRDYTRPDLQVGVDKHDLTQWILRFWGHSAGHAKAGSRLSRPERDAAAEYLGVALPVNAAQATAQRPSGRRWAPCPSRSESESSWWSWSSWGSGWNWSSSSWW